MLKRICDFVRGVNTICARFKFISTNARYTLFKSYCMSLYGCQLWDLESRHIDLFYVAWRKCVRRVLNINNRTHCSLLPHICSDVPINVQLINRFNKFYKSVLNSNNAFVRYCGKIAANGSRSAFSNSVNVANVHRCCHKSVNNYSDETIQQTAGTIKDFINMRDSSPYDANIQCIIDYLCTV